MSYTFSPETQAEIVKVFDQNIKNKDFADELKRLVGCPVEAKFAKQLEELEFAECEYFYWDEHNSANFLDHTKVLVGKVVPNNANQ